MFWVVGGCIPVSPNKYKNKIIIEGSLQNLIYSKIYFWRESSYTDLLSWALGLNLSTRFWVTRGLGLISTFKVWLTSGERLLPFRACVHYFYQFLFFFSSNDRPSKSIKKCFLFHLKSSFCSQDIQTFVIFSLPFHNFQIQKGKWKWNNLWCHKTWSDNT